MPTTDIPGTESVYQGGSVAPIREIAEKLGAQVDWDPTSAKVTVNGKVIPYDQIRDGRSYGNVNLIADAAGGQVKQNPDGTYSVYKSPASSPPASTIRAATTGSTSVTDTGAGQGVPAGWDPFADIKAKAASGDMQGAAAMLAARAGISPEQALQNLKSIGTTTSAPTPGGAPPSGSGPEQPVGGELAPKPVIQPFTYTDQPIDYATLQDRASQEAALWAQAQMQSLQDLAARYKQDASNQSGYIRQGLQQDIEELRAGEPARERRIADLMNQRGDAIYGSGVHWDAVRDQQLETQNKEYKLTLKAQNALQKLSDSLNLKLQDVASRMQSLATQQGNKAYLTLQQLADKAETQQFNNKKATWQMWLQGARLTLDQQTKANELWLNIQRIKSADDRAAAERELRAAIASGQLDLQYAKLAQDAEQFASKQGLEERKLTLQEADAMSKQTGYIYGLDGKPLLDNEGNMVPTLDRAKFDWDKQKFIISEQDKVYYQNEMLRLKEQGLINEAAYRAAQQEIQRGQLSLENAKLLETTRHNQATEAGGDAKAWSSAKSELDKLLNPQYGMTQQEIAMGYEGLLPERQQAIQAQRVAAAKAIVSRYYATLSDQDKAALTAYLKANGLM